MSSDSPPHIFDDRAAERFRANPSFVKTAIRVAVPEDDGVTRIATRFGIQTFSGPFYVVAEDEHSYGAAVAEFEAVHTSIGPNQWVKHSAVLAYELETHCVVETVVAEEVEAKTQASPGDWLVKQATGEVIVMPRDEFLDRYEKEARK